MKRHKSRKIVVILIGAILCLALCSCGKEKKPEINPIYANYDELVNEAINNYSSQLSNNNARTNETTGEANALKKAKSYLNLTAFSYDGLVEQLEYEGFTHDEAIYGAEHCGADWNEQAVEKARSYLELTAFSRDGLIEQLEYEGFTHSQAVYGVEQNGF